jgi:hypothetical protein
MSYGLASGLTALPGRSSLRSKERSTAPTPCRHMVSDLFHRPSGLLFTFPSRYLFTIGLEKYLDLPVSTGGFPQAIRVPGYLRIETKKVVCFNLGGYHPLGLSFPTHSANKKLCDFSAINSTSLPCNPHPKSQSVSASLSEGGIRPTI